MLATVYYARRLNLRLRLNVTNVLNIARSVVYEKMARHFKNYVRMKNNVSWPCNNLLLFYVSIIR